MHGSLSGDLVMITHGGSTLAELLVTNRGLDDDLAVTAFRGGLSTQSGRLAEADPDACLGVSFVTDWVPPPPGMDTAERPFRFQIPVHILYDLDADRFDDQLWDLAVTNVLAGEAALFPELYTGGVVSHADLVNRSQTLQQIIETLNRDRHVFLTAPRRYGKTSLMRAVHRRMAAQGVAIFLDVESVTSPEELAVRLEVALEMASREDDQSGLPTGATDEVEETDRVLQRLDQIRKGSAPFFGHLPANLAELQRPAIILDEVTYMLENMERERAVICLELISRISRVQGVRLVIAASTDLVAYLRSQELTLRLPRSTRLELEPFSQRDARLLVRALFARNHRRPAAGVVDRILQYAWPPVPYFIQILIFELEAELRRSAPLLSPELVDRVYRTAVMGPDCRRWFDFFEWHFRRYYRDQEGRAARLLLNELSLRPEGISHQAVKSLLAAHDAMIDDVKGMVHRLKYDMYVESDRSGVRISHRMLCEYWRRFHAKVGG